MEINIGDKVRFLNDIGGGKVTGFQQGGIVLVEDEDGFEVPVRQSEVVVVPDDDKKKIIQPSVQQTVGQFSPTPMPHASNSQISQVKPQQNGVATQTNAADDVETLEERVLRLEMTVKRLAMRIERLEAAKALREKIKEEGRAQQESKKQQKDAVVEVDLHAHELLDTTAGMSPGDIKEYQLQTFRNVMQEHIKDRGRKIVFIHGNGEGVLRKAIIAELRRNYKSCQYQDASFQQYGFGATMVIIK